MTAERGCCGPRWYRTDVTLGLVCGARRCSRRCTACTGADLLGWDWGSAGGLGAVPLGAPLARGTSESTDKRNATAFACYGRTIGGQASGGRAPGWRKRTGARVVTLGQAPATATTHTQLMGNRGRHYRKGSQAAGGALTRTQHGRGAVRLTAAVTPRPPQPHSTTLSDAYCNPSRCCPLP